jgi:PAS domain S-box-containing protein
MMICKERGGEGFMNVTTSELQSVLSGADTIVIDALLDNSPSMAIVADVDGAILRAGRPCCKISGWEVHELEGLTLSQYLATLKPSDTIGRRLSEQEIPLVRALRGERVMACEGSFAHRSGELIPIVVNAAPLARPGGPVIGAITLQTDLRPHKNLERAVHDLEREMLALHGELDQRIRGV